MAGFEPKKAKYMYFKVPSEFDNFNDSQIDEFAEAIWIDYTNVKEANGGGE